MSTASAPVIGALQTALADHRAGHLIEAEEGYRRVLALDPDNFDALHLLGVVAHRLGRHEEAALLIQRALGQRPHDAACLSNLGDAYRALGRTGEALDCQRRVIERRARPPAAYGGLRTLPKRTTTSVSRCNRPGEPTKRAPPTNAR